MLNVGREARLGGSVHFRWMYPFERYMKTLKAYVKNFARPEACMAEGYLAEECLAFCLEFLKNTLPIQEAINRNEDVACDEHILEGRPLQKPKEVTLSDKELEIAHRYVLMNTTIMDPYIDMRLEELQATDVRCARNETLCWKLHTERFAKWIKAKSSGAEVDAQSDVSNTNKGGIKCKILDWCSSEDVVVGEGEFCSCDQKYMIGRIALGPKAAAILVNSATVPDAYVWRPTTTVCSIAQAVGVMIPWPADRVALDSDNSSPSGHKTEASDEAQTKCKLFAWNGSEIVAEGIICSVDPTEKVNQIPLGPNATIIKVQKVINHDAFLWRPSAETAMMGDAVNETIAWPLDKIEFVNTSPEVSPKTSPELSTSKSTGSSKSAKQKCLLFDCGGSGKIVAEGRVSSTDPNDQVHFIPLGPNATKVWVDVSKIGDANVWRQNSEVECVADGIGTTIAWPNDKLKQL